MVVGFLFSRFYFLPHIAVIGHANWSRTLNSMTAWCAGKLRGNSLVPILLEIKYFLTTGIIALATPNLFKNFAMNWDRIKYL